jgi:cobalt-zinc-cadmium efflux system protein
MLIVAMFGLIANGFSILLLRGSVKSDLNIRSAFLHIFADTASSVVIIFGAIAVSLTNWYIIDPLLGIGISILILVWAWGLFKDSVNILLETAPKGMNIDEVSSELKKRIPDIVEITDMHIWEITSNMYSFAAHIRIGAVDYTKSKEILDKINELLDQKYGIEHATVQFELSS